MQGSAVIGVCVRIPFKPPHQAGCHTVWVRRRLIVRRPDAVAQRYPVLLGIAAHIVGISFF